MRIRDWGSYGVADIHREKRKKVRGAELSKKYHGPQGVQDYLSPPREARGWVDWRGVRMLPMRDQRVGK